MSDTGIFHAYDWSAQDEIDGEDRFSTIYAWTFSKDNQPTLLRITGFRPFCYIGLPRRVQGRRMQWTPAAVNMLVKAINKRLHGCIFNSALVHRPKLYYFKYDFVNNTYVRDPMMLVIFHNLNGLRRCKELLKESFADPITGANIPLTMHEADISIVRKMLTQRKCGYSQWFRASIVPVEPEDKISTIDEYYVDWKTITPLSQDQSVHYFSYPSMLCFDIEAYSDVHTKMPERYYAQHVAYMISCVYKRLGSSSLHKILIVYGDVEDIPDTETRRVTSEPELCWELCNVINELDPDIVLGYNNFNFDWPYLDAKIQMNLENWKPCGRLSGTEAPKLFKNMWKSSAYSYNYINFLEMPGRINLDLLPIIRRDYALSNYRLETVAKEFLGEHEGKEDVSPQEMFRIYERYWNAYRRVCEEHQVSSWEEIWQLEKHGCSTPELQEYFEARHELTRVGSYAVQDSVLPPRIFEAINAWTSHVQMSTVTGVTIMDLSTRGQQIRGLSSIYNIASWEYVLDAREAADIPYKGAYVHPPTPGVHDNVLCFDFSSLYPSLIIAYNICYTTFVPPNQDAMIPDDWCHVFRIQEDDGQVVKYKFIRVPQEGEDFPGFKGILPRLVQQWVQERKEVRKKQKQFSSTELPWIVYEKMQLALKISANSVYGMLGTKKGGKLPLIEAAKCVTKMGVENILWTNSYLEKQYSATVVYNDTDSTMVQVPGITRENVLEWGHFLEKDLNKHYINPLRMEFEKAGRMLSLGKKMYAFWLIDMETGQLLPWNSTNPKPVLHRGTVMVRRDRAQIQRRIFADMLEKILNHRPIEETYESILSTLLALMQRQVNRDDLLMNKAMGSDYKSENAEMKLFAEEMVKSGKPPVAGERLDFLIVEDRYGRTKKGHKMRLPSMFRENVENGEPEPVDVHYYLTNVLQGTVDSLFNIGYRRDLNALEEKYQQEEDSRFWKRYSNFLRQCCNAKEGRYTNVVNDALENDSAEEVIQYLRFSAPGRSIFDGIAKKTLKSTVINARIQRNPVKTFSKLVRQKMKVCQQIRSKYVEEEHIEDVECTDVVVEDGDAI